MAWLAQFPSRCPECELPIAVGDEIERRDVGWVHVDCAPKDVTYTPASDTSPLCKACFTYHKGECI